MPIHLRFSCFTFSFNQVNFRNIILIRIITERMYPKWLKSHNRYNNYTIYSRKLVFKILLVGSGFSITWYGTCPGFHGSMGFPGFAVVVVVVVLFFFVFILGEHTVALMLKDEHVHRSKLIMI